jgi:hypothetical protein
VQPFIPVVGRHVPFVHAPVGCAGGCVHGTPSVPIPYGDCGVACPELVEGGDVNGISSFARPPISPRMDCGLNPPPCPELVEGLRVSAPPPGVLSTPPGGGVLPVSSGGVGGLLVSGQSTMLPLPSSQSPSGCSSGGVGFSAFGFSSSG